MTDETQAPAGDNEPDLDALCGEWISAKAAETLGKTRRVSIEEKLLPFVERHEKKLGSKTTELDGYKVTVKDGESIKLVDGRFRELWETLNAAGVPEDEMPVEQVWKFDEKACAKLRDSHPAAYVELANAGIIEQKPTKPGVTIKAKRDE